MKKLFLLVPALALMALSACNGVPQLDLCKNSNLRRTTYTTAISAADFASMSYTATGREVPQAIVLGKQAAETALMVLDRNCPVNPSF